MTLASQEFYSMGKELLELPLARLAYRHTGWLFARPSKRVLSYSVCVDDLVFGWFQLLQWHWRGRL